MNIKQEALIDEATASIEEKLSELLTLYRYLMERKGKYSRMNSHEKTIEDIKNLFNKP